MMALGHMAAAAPPTLTEAQKITRLISYVRHLQGAVFIRNGTEHTPAEAAAHMQLKWEKSPKHAKTAQDFIRNLASKSSLTGKPYHIRFHDGKTLTAEEALMRELKRIEKDGSNE